MCDILEAVNTTDKHPKDSSICEHIVANTIYQVSYKQSLWKSNMVKGEKFTVYFF